jgi:hypothetical protein
MSGKRCLLGEHVPLNVVGASCRWMNESKQVSLYACMYVCMYVFGYVNRHQAALQARGLSLCEVRAVERPHHEEGRAAQGAGLPAHRPVAAAEGRNLAAFQLG